MGLDGGRPGVILPSKDALVMNSQGPKEQTARFVEHEPIAGLAQRVKQQGGVRTTVLQGGIGEWPSYRSYDHSDPMASPKTILGKGSTECGNAL
jgi:hypothetical protein